MRCVRRFPVFPVILLWMVTPVLALDSVPDTSAHDDLQVLQNADSTSKKNLVLNPKSLDSIYRFAVGVSYTGAQMRYQFTPKWAAEYRYQTGKASSDYGDIKSTVLGLRIYRFIPFRRALSWYLGGDGAYAHANAGSTDYNVSGFAMGAYGGMEYRLIPRLAIGADIGPYVISLKEKESGLSQTTLDFVINTAINFYLF
jgi:hypothetical protein